MAKQDKSKLKRWFETGKYPTQEQFWDWMDSYIHRDDQLHISANFPELDGVLQQKVDKEVFKHHFENQNNPHFVTKQQVGLGLADNTADLDKPISTAAQSALEKKVDVLHLKDDTNPHKVTKQQVGLGNVDNTTDLDKPISKATQMALDSKANHKHVHDVEELEGFDTDVTLAANSDEKVASQKATKAYVDAVNIVFNNHCEHKNNPHQVTKQQVGLGNVDNTSDLDKPISKATQAALHLKANHTHVHDVHTLKGFDTDVTLAANSDKKTASQKAVKTYVDAVNTALQARVSKLEKSQVLPGMIMAWKGAINTIPAGWKLCEALKDRFILGAGNDFAVGATGGARTHQLTVAELPTHGHPTRNVLTLDSKGVGVFNNGDNTKSQFKSPNTDQMGGNQPHNNMPPYYALAYIEYVGEESTAA